MPDDKKWFDRWCADRSRSQELCYQFHVAIPALGPSRGKADHLRYCCPVPDHDDRGFKCYINPGRAAGEDDARLMVWHCVGVCSDEAIRDALLDLGIHADCLGSWGTTSPVTSRDDIGRGSGSAALADQRRFLAILKLPVDLSAAEIQMCIQKISESDSEPSSDPGVLLSGTYDAVADLGKRRGLPKATRYRVAAKWCSKQVA